MDSTQLILCGLATWRLTHLLYAEAGPAHLVDRLRASAGHGLLGQALSCFYCLSLWVAAPLALWVAEPWGDRLLVWLAFSAAAILLERVTARSGGYAAVSYQEDPAPAQQAEVDAQHPLFP